MANLKTPFALLALTLLLSACASTVSTPRSREAGWAGGEDRVEDADLAADIRLELFSKLGFDALDIDVDVDGGRVRLRGEVEKRATQELAEEVARSVEGVQRVENRLRLEDGRPGDTPVSRAVGTAEREVQDAALEVRVGQRLLGEIGRYALDLEVEATEGVVSLRGTLPDADRKRLALKTAEETPGVEKVIDLLRAGR
jgi:osmotically-inducible protein OsmY